MRKKKARSNHKGKRPLSSLSQREFDILKASGMLWEFYPEAEDTLVASKRKDEGFADEMLRISGGKSRKKKKQKRRRFVLGVGQIWFSGIPKRGNWPFYYVNLSKNSAYNSYKDGIKIKTHKLGAYDKVRLVAEVIKSDR